VFPIRPQTFVVRHSVLDDESVDPIRMGQGHAKTHGASVILHVKRVAREPESFGEVIHDLGAVIRRYTRRPVAVSETLDSAYASSCTNARSVVGGWSAVRPALCYDLCAREEADAVLTILVKVAES